MASRKLTTHTIICIITGIVFITSGVFKLISIDSFEVYIFSRELFSLSFSSILARVIISGELILGALWLLQWRISLLRIVTLIVLGIFSIFLIIQVVLGNTENCQCFGTIIQLTPLESLIKNIVLIGMLLMLRNGVGFTWKHKENVALFATVFCLATPSLISPPDFMMHYPSMPENAMAEANKRLMAEPSLDPYHLESGKTMVCFFSVTCAHCIRAAEMISTMADKDKFGDDIIYVFAGEPDQLPEFWEQSHSQQFTYFFMPLRPFFSIAGPSVPSIYLVEDGVIKHHFHSRNIDENTIRNFF